MTTDPDLDRRGRQAAAGLRQRVGETTLSVEAPHRTSRRPLVVAVVALLLLVGGFALLRVDDDTPDEGGVGGTDQPSRLAFSTPPDGLEVTGAFEGPIVDEMDARLRASDVTIYRSPTSTGLSDPFVATLSTQYEPAMGDDVHSGDVEVLAVEEGSVEIQDLGDGRFGFTLSPLPGGRTITVETSGIPRETGLELVAVATDEGVGGVTIDEAVLPAGMQEVARVPFAMAAPAPTSFATLPSSGGIGYAADEEDDSMDQRAITVGSVLGQAGWLDATSILLDDPQSVEVRGQTAIAGTWRGAGDPAGAVDSGVVNWLEPDGTLVRVEGYGYSVDELVAMADDLVPLDDNQWQALLVASNEEREATGSEEGGTSTGTIDGIGEPIHHEPTPLITSFFFVQLDDAGERAHLGSISHPDDVLEVTEADGDSLKHALIDADLFGVVPPHTATIEIRYDDQSIESASWMHVAEGETFPLWAYAIRLPSVPLHYELIATAEDGSTITLAASTDGSTPPTITSTP